MQSSLRPKVLPRAQRQYLACECPACDRPGVELCHQCGAPRKDDDRFCARCGGALGVGPETADPFVGRKVAGSYTIGELVGVGGMGRVYKAEQQPLGRTVAIKLIHPHLLGDAQSVARFYTEAKAASRLNHPNSVSVIDFGRTDDGLLYLVMEFLSGRDLARVMADEGPLTFYRICDILSSVLGALDEAHELGVVHRDLKPENIILRKARNGPEIVKVVDFGLATMFGPQSQGVTSITSPGLVCGTPDYMSPEQARGESVDGRGDLYAVGVILFELLTERLPYVDDTPTKVVMRHIQDPIPDPIAVAPHRAIPPLLADVARQALAKHPSQRFQRASDMRLALRRVADSLRPPGPDSRLCTECGTPAPLNMVFCGKCAARLPSLSVMPPRGSIMPAAPEVIGRRFVGRENELALLVTLRRSALQLPVLVGIRGESGMGKTTLMREALARAAAEGDAVAVGGPHPSGAAVAYFMARQVMAALLGVAEADLASALRNTSHPLQRAGLDELLEPKGQPGLDGASRASAVGFALSIALRVAASRSQSKRVVVAIDDFLNCDSLSQAALLDAARYAPDVGLFVMLAYARQGAHAFEGRLHLMDLQGLDSSEASQFAGLRQWPGTDSSARYLPLHLEQLLELGSGAIAEAASIRLPDALALRLERLERKSLRSIQVLSVLGDRTNTRAFRCLSQDEDLDGLLALEKQKLVVRQDDLLHVVHPFVRQFVEAAMPQAARTALYLAAFEFATEESAPLEVRADYVYRAGEAMTALIVLERAGDLALSRGDAQMGVLSYRRGLERARREILEAGDVSLESALAMFSRKLADALERTGDVVGAEGVLREGLDIGAGSTIERARMNILLGRVAARRERPRDALRYLGMALELAEREQVMVVVAQAQVAIARVRRQEGDTTGALSAYLRAVEAAQQAEHPPLGLAARLALELGELWLDSGDAVAAAEKLEEARALSARDGAPALTAAAVGALGTLDELGGDPDKARGRYHQAATLAAEAGDSDAYFRWQEASAVLER